MRGSEGSKLAAVTMFEAPAVTLRRANITLKDIPLVQEFSGNLALVVDVRGFKRVRLRKVERLKKSVGGPHKADGVVGVLDAGSRNLALVVDRENLGVQAFRIVEGRDRSVRGADKTVRDIVVVIP